MSLLVTSFYTPTWEYPAHAKRLATECDALGLDHHIVERPDAGGYLANCRQKPAHIMEMLKHFRRPLLWVDVDASIIRAPDDIPGDVDFGAVPTPDYRDRVWHVGTLYFAPTRRALDLLERWCDALDDESSDEAALDEVWLTWAGGNVALGPDYMNVEGRRETPDPIVVHRLSASPEKYEAHRRIRDKT